jgi:hypothetical protein
LAWCLSKRPQRAQGDFAIGRLSGRL